MITCLSIRLPLAVVAIVIIYDRAQMLVLAQDDTQQEIIETIIKTIQERPQSPDRPVLIVITRRH